MRSSNEIAVNFNGILCFPFHLVQICSATTESIASLVLESIKKMTVKLGYSWLNSTKQKQKQKQTEQNSTKEKFPKNFRNSI